MLIAAQRSDPHRARLYVQMPSFLVRRDQPAGTERGPGSKLSAIAWMGRAGSAVRLLPDAQTQMTCSPVVFSLINLSLANECLEKWGHRMGPLRRANTSAQWCHALFAEGAPVLITTTSSLIREVVAASDGLLTRENTIELSRLCAIRSGLCRVGLRLWREFVFPDLGYKYAISYQDAELHNGNTYRFDGWRVLGKSSSGTDKRSGRKGRKKVIWVWPELPQQPQ